MEKKQETNVKIPPQISEKKAQIIPCDYNYITFQKKQLTFRKSPYNHLLNSFLQLYLSEKAVFLC